MTTTVKQTNIKLNTILNAFRMLLTVLVPLITFPYISRIFLTDGIGNLNFAYSFTNILAIVASLGIYSYAVREGARYRENKDEFSKFSKELLFINLISTIVTYIVLILIIFFIPKFYEQKELLLIYGVTIFFTSMGCDWVYGVYEEYKYITVRQIFTQLFSIICMFIFVHEAKDIYAWAIISSVSAVGCNVFNIIHARKYIHFTKKYKYEIIKHLSPIMLLFFTQLASKVYNNLDTVLLQLMVGSNSSGLYSAAVKINTIVITVFVAMTPVFVPRIMHFLSKEDHDSYNTLIKKNLKLVFSLALPCVVGMFMLSDQIITIISGEAFMAASKTMKILSGVVLFSAVTNVFYYNIMVVNRKEKYILLCTAITTVVNIVVSVILIPYYQENGAAIGSLVAEFIGLILSFTISVKLKIFDIKSFPSIWRYILGSAGIVGICFVLKNFIDSTIICFAVSVVASVAVYAIILLVTRDEIASEGIVFVKRLYFIDKPTYNVEGTPMVKAKTEENVKVDVDPANKAPSQRNSTFELLRIICMVLIIFHHIVLHGDILTNTEGTTKLLSFIFIPGGKIAYDVFLIISFFFLCSSSFKSIRFLKLWAESFFYGAILVGVCVLLKSNYFFNGQEVIMVEQLSIRQLLGAFFPIFGNNHSFASTYLLFYLIFPLIKIVSDRISKKQNIFIIVVLVFAEIISIAISVLVEYNIHIFNDIGFFILMYFVVLYYKNQLVSTKKNFIHLMTFVLCFGLIFAFYNIRDLYDIPMIDTIGEMLFTNQHSLFVIIAAFSLFITFKNINIKTNKVINFVAATTFGVLLIHDNNYFRYVLYFKILKIDSFYSNAYLPLLVIGFGLAIFVACSVIDILRKQLEKLVFNHKFVDTACNKVDNVVNNKESN